VRKPIYAEAVIFDLDGTLIDSTLEHYQATMTAAECLGGTGCGFTRYRRLLQEHTHFMLYQKLGVRADEESVVKVFISVWQNFSRSITPMPGVHEMLASLWEKGVVLGLVSGSQKDVVRASLQNFGLAQYFSAAYVYGSSKKALVRKEEAFAALMHTWHIPPSCITAIGDMPSDVRIARKHGMHAIGFLGGLGTSVTLKAAGAEYCIRKLSTLTKILRRREDV